jgi:hypothetical protein
MKGTRSLIAVLSAAAIINACRGPDENSRDASPVSFTQSYDSIMYNPFNVTVSNVSPLENIKDIHRNMRAGKFSTTVINARNGLPMDNTFYVSNLDTLVGYISKIESLGENPYDVIGEKKLQNVSSNLKKFLEVYSNFAKNNNLPFDVDDNPALALHNDYFRKIKASIDDALRGSGFSLPPPAYLSPQVQNNTFRRANGEFVHRLRERNRDMYDIIEE